MTMVLGCAGLVLAGAVVHSQSIEKPAGRVIITSKPPALEFEVLAERTSVQRGLTPATVEGLAAGTYKVVVRQSGSVAQRYVVKVEQGAATIEADFSLQGEWQKLRQEAETQQYEIVRAAHFLNDLVPKFLRDLAVESVRDEAISKLLELHGYGAAQRAELAAKESPLPAEEVGQASPAEPPKSGAEEDLRVLPLPPRQLAESDWDANTEERWREQVHRLRKAIKERDRLVGSKTTMEPKLQSLVLDLLILSTTNGYARRLVERYSFDKALAPPPE